MHSKLLVAAAKALVRKGLIALIERNRKWRVCSEAATGDEAFREAILRKPDVVILDGALPEIDGWEVARLLEKSECPPGIVVLSQEYSGKTAQCAVSWDDSVERLWAAIRAAARGETYVSEAFQGASPRREDRLTSREREVLQLLAEGRRPFQVARRLGISPKTVASHRINIMGKLGSGSLVEMLRYAMAHGMIRKL